ncbi:MAG: HP0268 family nuclease [Helicobacteraceae bacterium]
MELKLAKPELSGKPKTIDVKKIIESIKEKEEKIIYFDKTNSHKDLMQALKLFEKEGFSVYFKEVRYGLDLDDYMYQAHIL